MRGRIRLYAEIGYDFGEPIWETEVTKRKELLDNHRKWP